MDIRSRLRNLTWFCWNPGVDTMLALVSVAAMNVIFYVNAKYAETHPLVFLLLFVLIGNLGLNTLGPAWYVLRVRHERAAELGLTAARWPFSIAVSLAIAMWSWPELLRAASDAGLDEAGIIRQIAFNALVFWEVFFVFGWLQLRFERAFGILPAIPLASLGFAAYHFGTFPTEGLIQLFRVGLLFAIAFRITRSVLTLIPIAWSVVSSIGTIPAGFLATWEAVYLYIALVGIQLAGLAVLVRSSGERQPGTGSP